MASVCFIYKWKHPNIDNKLDRVNYPPERIAKIAAEAARQHSMVSLNDKLGLISDSIALAKAGYSKTSSVLQLIDGLRKDQERE